MPTYTANKSEGESHDIPEEEEIVSQHTIGGVEKIVTEKPTEYECEECGETFYEQHAYWGHLGSHSKTNE
jgi:formylmethanofuran dehydrogenase subunit E